MIASAGTSARAEKRQVSIEQAFQTEAIKTERGGRGIDTRSRYKLYKLGANNKRIPFVALHGSRDFFSFFVACAILSLERIYTKESIEREIPVQDDIFFLSRNFKGLRRFFFVSEFFQSSKDRLFRRRRNIREISGYISMYISFGISFYSQNFRISNSFEIY